MKKIVLILLSAAMLAACGEGKKETVTKEMDAVAFVDSIKALDKGIQLVDVRTADEFSRGAFPNAINIDFNGADFKEKIKSLDKNKSVYVYCLSGDRSGRSVQAFKDAGFAYVVAMKGGLLALNNAANQQNSSPQQPSGQSEGAQTVSVADFDAFLAKNKNVVVDFYADWCGPCKRMAPVLDELHNANKEKFTILKVNIDHSKDLAMKHKISSIPRLFVYKDGKKVDDILGFDASNTQGFKDKILASYK